MLALYSDKRRLTRLLVLFELPQITNVVSTPKKNVNNFLLYTTFNLINTFSASGQFIFLQPEPWCAPYGHTAKGQNRRRYLQF